MSLRNNQLTFKTSRIYLKLLKNNQKITCHWLHLDFDQLCPKPPQPRSARLKQVPNNVMVRLFQNSEEVKVMTSHATLLHIIRCLKRLECEIGTLIWNNPSPPICKRFILLSSSHSSTPLGPVTKSLSYHMSASHPVT